MKHAVPSVTSSCNACSAGISKVADCVSSLNPQQGKLSPLESAETLSLLKRVLVALVKVCPPAHLCVVVVVRKGSFSSAGVGFGPDEVGRRLFLQPIIPAFL